jgi:hypothetical protein
MERLTYQQLLAETYEETSRNLLVHQTEYEDDDQVEEHENHDYEKQEVDNPEEFNKFHGDRNTEKNVSKPSNPFDDKSKISIRYDKDIKTHVLNIDSRFRSYVNSTAKNVYPESKSSNFVFRPHRAYKNIVSVRLSSLEFPNVSYTFSKDRENITIGIKIAPATSYTYVTITEGNYLSASDLAAEVQKVLQAAFPAQTFTVKYTAISNTIEVANGNAFDMDFTPSTVTTPFDNGLGHYLGFRDLEYTGANSYTGESFPDIYGDTYVYIAINDYNVIEHQDFNNTSFGAFAKIQLNVPKNTMIFDQLNTTTKEYFFLQPTNISVLNIRLIDAYGRELDLQGMNFSVTVELKEALNISLYEKMREI